MRDYSGLTIGQYKIISPLGTGGMASVYRAIQLHLERDVAIKFILSDNLTQDNSATLLQRFDREAKTLAKLSHPNIVKVIDYGFHENIPFIVMEYITAGTLREQTGRPINYAKAARLLLPIARALAYAHNQGIIHRDIKPGNILLTSSGEPMLSDFGIAKILDIDPGNTLTGTNMGIGTPEYMAPEQWVNQISPQTDIYALGVVFYELITGRKPYMADTPAGVLIKQTTEIPPRPISLVPDLPVSVEQLILRAMAKNPEDRFAHMSDFANALEELLRSAPTAPAKTPLAESPTVVYAQAQPTMGMADLTPEKNAVLTGQPPKKPLVWLLGGGAAGLFVGGGILLIILLLAFLPSLINPAAASRASNGPQTTETSRLSADLAGVSATKTAVESTPTQQKTTPKPKPTATQVPTKAVDLSEVVIVFSSGPVNNSDVVLGSGSGGGAGCLACGSDSDETDPSVSKDGLQVIYSANYNGTYDIFKVSSQGGKASPLTTSTDQEESEADISPTGDSIVFKVSPKGDPKGEGDFYIMDISSGKRQSLGIHGRAPDWSPDGRQIAYMAREGNKSWQIYVYSLDSRSNQKVTRCPVNCRFPDWSPDMQFISFNLTTSADPSSTNPNGIAYVPAQGGEMVTLINNENAGRPAWTDAGWIVFNTSKGLEMIKPDGNDRRTLFQGNYWGASWSH